MIKKILVATDGSEYSRHAFSTAIEFAKQFNAEIELFHVVMQPRAYGTFTGGYEIFFTPEQIDDIGKEVIDATMEGIDTMQITVGRKTVTGYPAASIVDEVKDGR